MRMLFDFSCPACGVVFEALCDREQQELPCRAEGSCAGMAERQIPATTSFTVITPTHLRSKPLKAGTVHSHGPRPKSPGKISVGYGTTNFSRTE